MLRAVGKLQLMPGHARVQSYRDKLANLISPKEIADEINVPLMV